MTEPRQSTLDPWPQFMEAVRERLDKGRTAYGDVSFSRPPADLAAEIEEELLDVCGWSFVLWTRLRRLRDGIEAGYGGQISGTTRP